MAIGNLLGAWKRHLCAASLIAVCALLGACGTSSLSPQYVSQGMLSQGSASGPVVLHVVDRISNTAPMPSSSSGVSFFQHNAAGEQLVCPSCAYQLDASPVELVRQFVEQALQRQGMAVSNNASRRLVVEVLRFEFFEPEHGASLDLRLQGWIGLHATVFDHGVSVADNVHLESNPFMPGATLFRGDVENWVSRSVSLSVENTLRGSPSDALKAASYR